MNDFSRRAMIARLNKDAISLQDAEDNAQMGYLNKWHKRHPKGDMVETVTMLILGAVLGMVVITFIKAVF